MNKTLNTLFTGRNVARDDFLYNFFDSVCDFLGRTWAQDVEFYTFAREILKNIHDHNGGYGYTNIKVTDNDIIVMEIGNSPCPDSVNKEHSPDHKVNCRVGLNILKEPDLPFIKIETDKDVDYKYTITYNRNLLPPNRLKPL